MTNRDIEDAKERVQQMMKVVKKIQELENLMARSDISKSVKVMTTMMIIELQEEFKSLEKQIEILST